MHILVSSVPGLGHLHPVLPVALAATDAGHEVLVATGADRLAWVEGCGAAAVPAGLPHDELVSSAAAMPAQQRVQHMFTTLAVPPMARDLLPLVERWSPDVLLHEEGEYAAPLVAALTGLPCVTHSWPSPARPAHLRRLLHGALRGVWDAAGASGPVRQVGHDYLDSCPPLLQGDGLAAVDARTTLVRHAGFDGPSEPSPPWLDALPRPAVYVTLGTEPAFSRPELLQRIVDAAARLPGVVVSTGPHPVEAVRAPHEGVHVVQYLPQSLVLPHVDAVVCHGGAGTSAAALVHGLPLLVLPGLAPSQQAVAERVEAAGVGQRLSWDDAGPRALERAVLRLVGARGPAQEVGRRSRRSQDRPRSSGCSSARSAAARERPAVPHRPAAGANRTDDDAVTGAPGRSSPAAA